MVDREAVEPMSEVSKTLHARSETSAREAHRSTGSNIHTTMCSQRVYNISPFRARLSQVMKSLKCTSNIVAFRLRQAMYCLEKQLRGF